MRKLNTNKNTEEKNKRIGICVSIGLFVLLVLSYLGYAVLTYERTPKSDGGNEEDIVNLGNIWRLNFNGEKIYLKTSPNEIEDVIIDLNEYDISLNKYSGKILYISSDNQGISDEIASNLGRFAFRTQKACYGECEEDLPERNCEDNLIVWTESDENKVYSEENCIFIEGDMTAVDAFLYKIFNTN